MSVEEPADHPAPRGLSGGSSDESLSAAGYSDAQLLAQHVAGDTEAFTILVHRHRDRLWAVALRTTQDPEEAADALQDALISAFRRASQFRGESAVTTWLHRIVVNASLDRLRRRNVRATVALPEEQDVSRESLVDPTDHINQREMQLVITQALAELPADQRQAVLLVDIEGYTIEEAAKIIGCPSGTVKSRCSRARVKLAKQLAHLRNSDGNSPVVPTEGGQP